MMKFEQNCTPQHRLDLLLRSDQWTWLLYGLICTFIWAEVGNDRDYYGRDDVRKNGMYLLPYYALLLFIFLPLVYVQVRLGQSRRQNVLELFARNMPLFEGVALCLLFLTYIRACTDLGQTTTKFYDVIRSPQPQAVNTTSSMNQMTLEPGGKMIMLTLAWFIAALTVVRGPSWFSKVAAILSSGGTICLLVTLMTSQITIKPPNQITPYGVMMTSSLQITNLVAAEMARNLTPPFHVVSPTSDVRSVREFLYSTDVWLVAAHRHIHGLVIWAGLLPSLGRNTKTKEHGHPCWPWVLPIIYQSLSPIISWFYPRHSVKAGDFALAVSAITRLLYTILKQAFVLLSLQEVVTRRFHNRLRRIGCPELVLIVLCLVALVVGGPYACYVDMASDRTPTLLRWYIWLLTNMDRSLFFLVVIALPAFIASFARLHEFDLGCKTVLVCIMFAISSLTCSIVLLYELTKTVTPRWENVWLRPFGFLMVVIPLLLCIFYGCIKALVAASGEKFFMKLKNSLKPISCNDESLPLVTPGPVTTAIEYDASKPGTSSMIPSESVQSSISGLSSMSVASSNADRHGDMEILVLEEESCVDDNIR